ncbi:MULTISPECIES: DUF1631 domain-containing protein [unclassified Pseudomonas]|uniref:DUF1631 domain-containing protein n=1 Tax=unclassified Pseudomonas TaxID=196821 RepID=UPI0024477FA4|nr:MULTISPECIES: DUF1631 domain-containing protein [unclassified Pseudomonas]MDG9922182.1 DUF1631 domain-containing protein [Pseudomonas sp. GD04045]MDH0033725.1 DUF1631 domain-containing protein [Pseudomonas sp. GD04019]
MSSQDLPPPQIPGVASRAIQPRFGELVQDCRKLVMNNLAEHLTGLFAQVDDTLFEGAEKAENNKVQSLFFDAMRDLRKLRPQIERSYHQRVAQNFADFLDGKLKAKAQGGDADSENLSLMQNEEYEESLQVTNMVSKVKARSSRALFALEQRLALLNNGQKLVEDANPFGPQALAEAFREALTPHPLPLRIKVILYMLFDRHVMQGLDTLYEMLNQRLIHAGILPNLKFTAQRSPSASPPSRPAEGGTTVAAAQAPAGTVPAPAFAPPGANQAGAVQTTYAAAPIIQAPADLSAPPPQDPGQLLGGLAALLSERRQQDLDAPLPGGTRSIASFAPRTATSTYSAGELLEALTRLQQQSASTLTQRLQGPQPVEDIKVNLQQQLESLSSLPGQQKLADQEADVIDLVGMLFDFILDDDNLPHSCKTALSHLHTPYLKVALQDKALFTQHHHPARRLLNTMAQAGVLYGGEGDERGLLAKIHWVVERVIHGFTGDLLLFDNLLEEFNEFVTTLKHKVELREKRAVEAAKGRDRLLGARQQAVAVIQNVLRDRQLPSVIHNFLELTWADVLVFVLLRHGERSAEWQRAGEVAEQLAWSGTPLDADGRSRLQNLRVTLLDELRKGLELLGGYHEDGIRRLLQDIVACQHAVQAQQPQLAAQIKSQLQESPLGAMLGEDAVLAEPVKREGQLTARAQALIKELQQLEFGTWFEFVQGKDTLTLKLSWFSPTTHNYMFVDHSGQRVAVKPIRQLANEMEQGLARIVAPERSAPLVDRALGAIYRVLQRFTGRANEVGQGA